ncbi:urease accessory protein UreD [Chitinophaga nivalis]|uniref:Urease accessory protein UreD n=1 Tax=Chitinophaga nivalis TaxID=2991709 RepID=A0ABT3IEV3_9BACT|nr:urease accessory protein UreD [Chitinophaga nivalis]MCW3467818.1 urease accessory protein UreD [Chitinophaga nivalis]MCW3482490.1 urease accessory protein UreD [Chitinophaga nivalis]
MIQKDNSLYSKLFISNKKEGEKTLLHDSAFDIPFKIVHYGSRGTGSHLELMLMSSSPGMMDGDIIDVEICCRKETATKLFTQSYNKVHPCKKGTVQRHKVLLEDNALFSFLPHPLIPFRNAIYQADNEIRLSATSHLLWSDIMTAGRVHSGERFEFSRIHSKTKIYVDGRLVIFDNQLLMPGEQAIEELLFYEGYTHQATLFIVSPYVSLLKQEFDELFIEQFDDMKYGYTQCAPQALMIRILGNSGEGIYEWLYNIGNMCWEFIQFQQQQHIPKKAAKQLAPAGKKISKKKVKT